jgi:hypothetical protein
MGREMGRAMGRAMGREMGREMGQPEFTTADQLLDALEHVEINRLTADVRYTKIAEFLGEREMRLGKMQFTSTPRPDPATRPAARPATRPDPKRRFGVQFDKLYIGNIQDDQPKIYIFDGRWFVEKLPNEKLIVKREVVRPGDVADPLRIGEGPFPIPIGQKKEDILRRFDAELLDADDGLTLDPDDENDPAAMKAARNLVRFTRGSYQIRLTPKEVFGDTLDLAEVRLWYKRDGAGGGAGGGAGEGGENGPLLPRMARTVDVDGNVSIIELINVKVGDAARIDEAMFDVAVPPDWNAEIRPFDG